jgi:hypothetical protein
MKVYIPKLVMIAILSSMALGATGEARRGVTASDRGLSSVRFLDDTIASTSSKISIDRIRNQIIDIHKNVKLCIEYEFAKQNEDLLEFKEILRGCVGDDYSIVLKFYDDMNSYIREVTKDSIKSKLRDGFCNDHLIECLDFFKIIEILIDKDFDLLKSLEFNKVELTRKLGALILNHLTDITESQLDDYDALRSDLLQERKFLNEFFRERYDEYLKRTAGRTPAPGVI